MKLHVREREEGYVEGIDAENARTLQSYLNFLLDRCSTVARWETRMLRDLMNDMRPFLQDDYLSLPPIDHASISADNPVLPLEYVVYWKNEHPPFNASQWDEEHRPLYERSYYPLLARNVFGRKRQVGDRVQLFECFSDQLKGKGDWYTIEAIYDHQGKRGEPGALPGYSPDLWQVYQLSGLDVLVSEHAVLDGPEPPPLSRLFARKTSIAQETYDIHIQYASSVAQRQKTCLGPYWVLAPEEDGAWLDTTPYCRCLSVSLAQSLLEQHGDHRRVAYLEHASINDVTGEVEAVHACSREGERLGTVLYLPWENELSLQPE